VDDGLHPVPGGIPLAGMDGPDDLGTTYGREHVATSRQTIARPVRIDNVRTFVYAECSDKEVIMTASKTQDTAARNVNINLRANQQQRTLIDRAAEVLGKSRSDFMLDVARREAESVLLDQRYFALDPAAFQAFVEQLDAPPADNPRLRRLLAEKAPWEQ